MSTFRKTSLLYITLAAGVLANSVDDAAKAWLQTMDSARKLHDVGQLRESAALYADAVRIADQFDAEGRAKLLALDALASAYADCGRFMDAEVNCHRALHLSLLLYGTKAPEYAVELGSLGAVYVERGETNRGAAAVRESMRILEHAVPGSDERLVRQRICLAQLLTVLAGYEEAAALLESARESAAADLRAVALNSLGVIRQHQHRNQEALELFEQAVRTLPDRQPLRVRALTNLGMAYAQAGDWDRAGRAYGEALAIDGTREDAAQAALLKRYAEFQARMGRRAEAKAYRARAKRVLETANLQSGSGMSVDVESLKDD